MRLPTKMSSTKSLPAIQTRSWKNMVRNKHRSTQMSKRIDFQSSMRTFNKDNKIFLHKVSLYYRISKRKKFHYNHVHEYIESIIQNPQLQNDGVLGSNHNPSKSTVERVSTNNMSYHQKRGWIFLKGTPSIYITNVIYVAKVHVGSR